MPKSYKDIIKDCDVLQAKAKGDAILFIENGIWDIDKDTLVRWINNFHTDEEKLLSAFLLDSFIFRSKSQTTSLLYDAFGSVLPSALNNEWEALEQDYLLDSLTRKYSCNEDIRIVPVIRSSDDPTKSGPLLARLYRRNIRLNKKHFIWHWQISKNIKNRVSTFVFIDDTLATGNQFTEFLEDIDIYIDSIKNVNTYIDNIKNIDFIYIPLLACELGIKKLNKEYPDIKVYPIEYITEDMNFFGRYANYSDLKDLYLEVEKEKLSKKFLKQYSCGYGQLGLTISYEHATPNATLPLFWYESEDYRPLVRR